MSKRDEYGLDVYGPAQGQERTCDVIFLHGIAGTAQSTFSGTDGTLWTKRLLDDIPGARIIHPRYKSPRFYPFKHVGFSLPADHGPALANLLTSEGVGEVNAAIVAYSLGAVYAINALHFSATAMSARHRRLIKAVSGVAFLAGAVRGSPWATFFREWPFATPTLKGLAETDVETMERVEWFATKARPQFAIQSTAYIETKPVWGLTAIPRANADPRIFGCDPIPLPRNHITIARVSGPDDLMYRSLLCDLRSWLSVRRIPESELTIEEMQLLSQELLKFPDTARQANFVRRLRAVASRLSVPNVSIRTRAELPLQVELTQFRHAVALGLIDLSLVFPDDVTFEVVQGPLVA